jgi:hypothetical protein
VPADVHRDLGWYWREHEFPPRGLRACVALERANAEVFAAHRDAFDPDVVMWWAMGGMSLSLLEQARRAARQTPQSLQASSRPTALTPSRHAGHPTMSRPRIHASSEVKTPLTRQPVCRRRGHAGPATALSLGSTEGEADRRPPDGGDVAGGS